MEVRTDDKFRTYARLRNKVKVITRKAVIRHERQVADNITENPKKFWGYVKSKTTVKERIPSLRPSDDAEPTYESREKAEILSNFFASVFTVEPLSGAPTPLQRSYEEELRNVEITNTKVVKLL